MNELVTISGVRGYVDENGTAHLGLEDVSRGLGFITVATSGNVCVRWNTVHKYLMDLGVATSCNGSDYQSACPEFVPENIFYRLAMKAKNEVAEKFQAKVADEILPSIRKTGVYVAPQVDSKMLFQIAQALEEKEKQIALLTPAAEFGNAVSNNQGGILIRDYVKVLENDGIKIGQDKFFSWLHLNGYIYRIKGYRDQWMVYKKFVEQGLFRVKETPVSSEKHGDWISYTLRLTGKGQRYFYEKLKQIA